MKFIQEFKEFAIKGNMIDMAIGIIIGAAFKDVINVLVEKVLMPPLSLFTTGVDMKDSEFVLREAHVNTQGKEMKALVIDYGELIEVTVDFLSIAFVIFIVIKFMNSLKSKAQDPKDKKVVTPKDIELLNDLKELLITQNELLKAFKK